MMEELVMYTPHTGLAYESDNARVYTLLSATLSGASFVASITRYQRNRNGWEDISVLLLIIWGLHNGKNQQKLLKLY